MHRVEAVEVLGVGGVGSSSSKVLIFIRSCVAVLARALRGV